MSPGRNKTAHSGEGDFLCVLHFMRNALLQASIELLAQSSWQHMLQVMSSYAAQLWYKWSLAGSRKTHSLSLSLSSHPPPSIHLTDTVGLKCQRASEHLSQSLSPVQWKSWMVRERPDISDQRRTKKAKKSSSISETIIQIYLTFRNAG